MLLNLNFVVVIYVANWFNSELTRKVRNGVNTSFWDVAWRVDISFRGEIS